jgi:nicotinate-nucleotide--dimethylbenzimidazole phosphoribosyltransferase
MNKLKKSVYTVEPWNIPQLDQAQLPEIQRHIDTKTKPIGALGQLESIATKLNLIQGYHSDNYQHLENKHPTIMMFAADHGIAQTT